MTTEEALADAKAKYHLIVTGSAARVVFDGNSGDRVEYTAANSAVLLAYIRTMDQTYLVATAQVSKPIGFLF